MAVSVQFGPSLSIGGTLPPSFGGRPAPPPGVERASAQPRPLPAPSVTGDGSFRFPHPAGLGLFRPPLIQLSLPPSNFIDQAERETPAVIALRGQNVNVTA